MHGPVVVIQWIQRLFLISALIAAINNIGRADFNLPLYIFAYLSWGLQKVRISIFLFKL